MAGRRSEQGVRLLPGDARDALARLPDATFEACITDPPHGVTRNQWDRQPDTDLWRTVHRVLKPGE